MELVCEINKCNGCMACIEVCPKKCIKIKDNIKNYNAVIESAQCLKCEKCKRICPNNSFVSKIKPIEWNQGWSNHNVREQSSSGGAASAIIKGFIKSGGYVASCLLKDGEFIFDITNDLEKAKAFSGSKYVKSNPDNIYKKIKTILETNKVLFLGLPCQVEAVKRITNNSKNLYTIDLICHGTPSPKLLKFFLNEHNIDIKKSNDVKFRKNTVFGTEVDGRYITPEGIDDYMLTFLDSLDYTDNCYSCKFATFERVGDVTLGDSWGTEYKLEEKKGVSLILIQSEKGKELLKIADMKLFDVDIDTAIRDNHQLRHPSVIKPEREIFLDMIMSGKTFAYSTFYIYKKRIIKRHIKKALMKLHLYRPQRKNI